MEKDTTLDCWESEAHCSKQVPAEGTMDQKRRDELVGAVNDKTRMRRHLVEVQEATSVGLFLADWILHCTPR